MTESLETSEAEAVPLSAEQMAQNLAAILSLLDELQTLRVTAKNAEKDAARYRWLRIQEDEDFLFGVVKNPHFDVYESAEELDAAIDAAMKGES